MQMNMYQTALLGHHLAQVIVEQGQLGTQPAGN